MGIEHFKRWQWATIGLIVGVVVAWIWSNLQASGGLRDAVTLGSAQFERALKAEPVEGHPRIKGITVHEDQGRYSVWMKMLQPDPSDPHPRNPRHYRYVSQRLNPTSPFLPDAREAPTQSVMWRVNPSAVATAPKIGKHPDGPRPLWINGAAVGENLIQWLALKDWKIQPGQWSDPGSAAELSLSLRPATYQMMIVLSQAQDKPVSNGDLAVTLNGHVLPPLIAAKKASGSTLETTLPKDAFVEGDSQVLRFSRKDLPVKIWEIRLIDPSYSIVDYLTYAKQKHPEIDSATAWWDAPRVRYSLCIVGGILFFGGVWPTIVRLLTGAETARSGTEEEYDLDRFKGEAPKEKPDPAPLPTGDELSDLEDELRKNLELQAAVQEPPKSPPASAPVQLSSEPVAPVVAGDPHGPAEYKGEYYPVVRPAGEKHDGQK